ncbi:MAG: nitrogenase [Methanobrevibacter arboriphilus]|uniref:Nitrogenase n=1 Tax=Methanobrevibacter arboriphilus TaxID=39441 RepID=A0A843AF37_METAZ|nr:nitrogenase component 1 [Methanobrevibacter arboriphilus]MBF4468523.1 nitrogenase [Methanobrevibacter arboriphilus]
MSNKNISNKDKIDLNKKTCPTREQRANGINLFFGKASELLNASKEGNLKCTDRKFQQSGGCLLNFYLAIRVATIRDAAIIFNGPVGCSTNALGFNEYFRLVPPELGRPEDFELHWLTTNLDEDDVIFGAKDKLTEAIKEAEDRYSPKAIFILTTCVTGIIGEDIEGIVSELQKDIDATIVPIHCEGVRSRIIQTGYDALWHGILKYLVEPQEKQEDLVNIASMLSYTWQDRLEVKRLLGKIGLRVNFVPEFATVDELKKLTAAAVTAPICPTYTDYLSKGLTQEFNVPHFMYPNPVGIKNTDNWLRQIAKHTGKEKEVEELIKEEHKKYVPKLKTLQEEFKKLGESSVDGDKINLLGSLGQGRLVTQLPYFDELGVKATSAMAQDFDDLLINELEEVIETVGDFDIMVNTFQSGEQMHITNHTKPDVALTCPLQGGAWKLNSSVARLHAIRGDPTIQSAQIGYSGSIAYGNFLLQALKNTSYQRTMTDKNKTAYKNWYLEQPDPLYFAEKGK